MPPPAQAKAMAIVDPGATGASSVMTSLSPAGPASLPRRVESKPRAGTGGRLGATVGSPDAGADASTITRHRTSVVATTSTRLSGSADPMPSVIMIGFGPHALL